MFQSAAERHSFKQLGVFVTITTAVVTLLTLFSTNALAQTHKIHVPLEVQEAYEKQTRALDGTPGERYWQNRAQYAISATLDTLNKTLIGSEAIVYFNNSPDTLDKIIVKLYQDIYKTGGSRAYDLPKADITDGVKITRIALNDEEMTNINGLERYWTNLHIPLSEKLQPGASLGLSIDWSYQFATEFLIAGSGKCGSNTYFASYWFPQIAVYDDISGWDEYGFNGLNETYNDFSLYEVRITVPSEFVVWATGVLQNPDEVLTKKYFDRYNEALTSDSIITIVDENDRKSGGITPSNNMNTWHYKADDITDFAFGTSSDFVWDLTSLVVDNETGRRAVIGAAYDPQSQHMREATGLCTRTIEFLSNELPGIPYPFPTFTAFQGTSAWEYPMMTNIRDYESRKWLFIGTLTHEVVHSYFPFYVGTNERKYSFMDEGWAHMLPLALQTQEIRKIHESFDARTWNNIGNYEGEAGTEKYDKPPMVLTTDSYFFSLHVSNHNRPATAYYFLQDMLGEDLFKTALQEYIDRWKHRHPVPTDFFNTFNEVVGTDLTWYWKPWLFEFGYPDLGLEELTDDNDGSNIVIRRKGNIPVPINVRVTFADGSETTIYKTARVWEKGDSGYRISIPGDKRIKRIELGDETIPDVNRSDNILDVE